MSGSEETVAERRHVAATAVVGVAAATVAVGGWTVVADAATHGAANRWVLIAGAVLAYEVGFVAYHLDADRVGVALAPPNLITLARGGLYAATAGFLFVPPATPVVRWAPAACYGTGVVLDFVDGSLARRMGRTTTLGAKLDLAFDTLGFLVAPLVAVAWGRLPVVYLSLSAARYVYRAGIGWRTRRGLAVGDLPASRVRRPLAALQMGFIAVALAPVLPASVIHPVAVVVLVPSLATFARDYLTVTGRLERLPRRLNREGRQYEVTRDARAGVTGSVEGGRSGVDLPASGRSLYFAGPRTVRIEREALTDPDPDEVLVEARVSAVSSGTELLIYRGEMPRDLPADESIDALAGDLTYPLKYGYATVGDVVATGSAVDDRWHGRTVFAFNPHESHFTAAPEDLVPVPEGLSPSTAALLPTAETATTLVMDGRPRVGERVVVFGAGMVGLVTTSVLAEFPLERLTVVEPVAHRREMAASLGADETLTPDQVARIGERGDPAGADLVYELSGQPTTLDDAIDAVGYDGRIVVGSWYGRKRAETDLGGFFHRNRIDVSSSQVSTLAPDLRGRWTKERRMDTAWDRLDDVATDRLVTHRVPFEDAAEAYRLLDGGPENALQVLLTYE